MSLCICLFCMMYVSAAAHVLGTMWMTEDSLAYWSYSSSLPGAGFLCCLQLYVPGWRACELLGILLFLVFRLALGALGLQMCTATSSWLSVGFEDSNSGPCAFTESALLKILSPQPLRLHLLIKLASSQVLLDSLYCF